MSDVQSLLRAKGSQVFAIRQEASVSVAAILMTEYAIGSLVVTSRGTVVGILTERDVLRRVVAAGRNPQTTTVGQVMSQNVCCVHPRSSLDDLECLFQTHHFRHVPVVDDTQRCVGLVSTGDLITHRMAVAGG